MSSSTMVPDTPDVEKVLFAKDGVAEGLAPGKIVVDMSSISPIEDQGLCRSHQEIRRRLCGRTGLRWRSGCQERCADHHGWCFRHGVRQSEAVVRTDGKNITLVGGVGAGQICKVCNQIIVALNIEAVGEALLLASKAGVDPGKCARH